MQFTTLLLSAAALAVQAPTDTLRGVTIVADKGAVVSVTDTVSIGSATDIPDVLFSVPGLFPGDYGGEAGLKTAGLRGLGAAHTAVYIDGVRVGNVQSGQADLGFIDLSTFSTAVVDYAQNSLSFESPRPVFRHGNASGRATLRGGSFGTFSPSAQLALRLSEGCALRLSASSTGSRGDYPFDDTRMANNDIFRFHAGADLFGEARNSTYHLKAHWHRARRGTPGSKDWPTPDDRQNDDNAFVQGVLRTRLTDRYTLGLSAKAALDNIFYTSAYGDSDYRQKELQLNSTHSFRISRGWTVSAAAGLRWDGLASSAYSAARTGVNGVVSAALRLERFQADLSLEYEGYFDRNGLSRNSLSPSLGARFRICDGIELSGFARRACRVPTFNELYFAGYGNPGLKPEDAFLNGVGLKWDKRLSGKWRAEAGVDGYCNLLRDKISSAPSEADPNIWLPYNIGKVRAAGLEASAGIRRTAGAVEAGLTLRYAFLDATDRTPGSADFGTQLAYVARHSAGITADASVHGWRLKAQWNLRCARRDAYGPLPDWNTLDLSIEKPFEIKRIGTLAAFLLARNLTDSRYETVRGYPMPGRALTAGLSFAF